MAEIIEHHSPLQNDHPEGIQRWNEINLGLFLTLVSLIFKDGLSIKVKMIINLI